MDRTKLKNYAPQARREFIQAMIDRAAYYGLTADEAEPVVEKGDVAVIGGRSFPIGVARKRKALEDCIKRHGFQQTMDAMAYTWFNRLVAIRYMELHGYLEHGYRVLSHPEGKSTPEIVEHAEHVELAGLKKDRVIDLKLAGNKEGELYRLLLTAQCNALHSAMPFLFERIDDETELLLPDNLLNSDSLIRKLVNEIEEDYWNEVEIIGWLYQFYISERKDEVIGKVVASEDIPAATQLFTPNWIVKYLVQNTLGRQWLATYPQSALRQKMEYYIEPAEQTPEVQEQLNAITPTSLNPEELTLLDPACGSGHILVEAYDLFKAIYQERGYRAKDIPALILQKNLFGLEIDDRAAQLAAFALMMKARADDRRIFDSDAKPNVVAIQESEGGKEQAEDIAFALGTNPGSELHSAVCELHDLFENAKTFGSLIQVPPKLSSKLPEIEKRLDDVVKQGDLIQAPALVLTSILRQTRLLTKQYNAVVANPPYMGRKYMPPLLRAFAEENYTNYDNDLYSPFIVRFRSFSRPDGLIGFMSPFTWMFIPTHEQLRMTLINSGTISSLVQLEYSGFAGATVPVCISTHYQRYISGNRSSFIRLEEFRGPELQAPMTLEAIRNPNCGWYFLAQPNLFASIPGSPIAYWVPKRVLNLFIDNPSITDAITPATGLQTGDNTRFIRRWHEVPFTSFGNRWRKLNDGGENRKWYGNFESVIDWKEDGKQIRGHKSSVIRNEKFYGVAGLTWNRISSAYFSVRYLPEGFIFDQAGDSAFPVANYDICEIIAYLNSAIGNFLGRIINPTLNFTAGNISKLPLLQVRDESKLRVRELARQLIAIAMKDWDSSEVSWNFTTLPTLVHKAATVHNSQEAADSECLARLAQMKELEEENNLLFIETYELQDELSTEVPDVEITLYRPDRAEDIRRLLSYAIGCVMGRYSLDTPGLIYAHSGNQNFNASQYKTFRVDDDGIIPLLETDWGIRDDATNRLVEFVSLAWPKDHLEENLKFVAGSLGPTSNEQPRDTIRRYLATGFYKHHLLMYKKRPIYWLFSSGKLRAFQCLIYLHRYNEGTLARIRTEYVIPLQGQIAARIDQLEGDKAKATSTSHRTKIQKEQDKLKKQQAELATFEEKLKHYADMRICLDLDDGVKVNYAKFGDLLAESKAITGGKDDE